MVRIFMMSRVESSTSKASSMSETRFIAARLSHRSVLSGQVSSESDSASMPSPSAKICNGWSSVVFLFVLCRCQQWVSVTACRGLKRRRVRRCKLDRCSLQSSRTTSTIAAMESPKPDRPVRTASDNADRGLGSLKRTGRFAALVAVLVVGLIVIAFSFRGPSDDDTEKASESAASGATEEASIENASAENGSVDLANSGGSSLAFLDAAGTIRHWDPAADPAFTGLWNANESRAGAAVIEADGERIFFVDTTGGIRLYDPNAEQPVVGVWSTLNGNPATVQIRAMKSGVVFLDENGGIRQWDPAADPAFTGIWSANESRPGATQIEVDGERIFFVDTTGGIRLYDPNAEQLVVGVWSVGDDAPGVAAMEAMGDGVVFVDDAGGIRRWDPSEDPAHLGIWNPNEPRVIALEVTGGSSN